MCAKGIVDERLEATMGLFEPTARQAEAAEEVRAAADGAPRRRREWEQRPENRVFSYRIGEDLNGMLLDAVEEYLGDGWQTTISDVLRAWALAGREAWERGEVEVPGKAVRSGSRRRTGRAAGGDAGGDAGGGKR